MIKSIPKGLWIQGIILASILSVAFTAFAETLILQDQACYDLSGYMEILSDPADNPTVRQVADRKDWMPTTPGKVPNLGFSSSAIWIRISLTNGTNTFRRYYVSFEYPVTSSVTFYRKDRNGQYSEETTGSSVPASENVGTDRYFLFPVALAPGEKAVVYLRVQTLASLTLPVRMLSDEGLLCKAIRDYTLYGGLFGFLLLVVLYFVTVGSFLYKGKPIWLALYSFFFGLHVAIRSGLIHLVLPDACLGIVNILQLAAVAGLFFTGAKFFRLFLSVKSQSKVLDRVMMFFQYLGLTYLLIPLLPLPVILILTLILIVVNPLFSIGLAFYFWRKGVPNAGFFAVGWVMAHLVSVYDFFRIHGVVPYEPLREWPIPFSLFVALFFLSAALIRQNATDHLMAETDPLTRLANRRKFDETLHQEWDRCRRLSAPLSVIMADVDHFKQYNDTFGHRAGDQCLCRIADVLLNYARRSGDLAVRYGGEEFILLLPHMDASQAFAIAERIRCILEKTAHDAAEKPKHKITLSLGVVTLVPQEDKIPEDLVLEADKALYDAKRAGRNRTVVSDVSIL